MNAANRYADRYIGSLEESIALLAAYAEEHKWPSVDKLEPEHIEDYLVYFKGRPRWFGVRAPGSRPISQSHVEGQYRRLKTFFGWLLKRGHIESNPLSFIPHPHIDEKTVPTVTDDQARALLKVTDPQYARTRRERFYAIRDRSVLYILLDSPGRRREIATLTLANVDLDAGMIKVMGKGRRERWMALGSAALEALWEYLRVRGEFEEGDHLWVDQLGRPMVSNWLYLMLIRLGKRAGIKGLHTHRFRHTYAVNALRAGMPERILQIAGGWRRIPDTYLRTLDEEDAARIHRSISPADRLNGVQPRKNSAARGRL